MATENTEPLIRSGSSQCGHPNICSEVTDILDNNFCYKTVGTSDLLANLSPSSRKYWWKTPAFAHNYRGNTLCTSPLTPSQNDDGGAPGITNTQWCTVDGSPAMWENVNNKWGYVPNSPACVMPSGY